MRCSIIWSFQWERRLERVNLRAVCCNRWLRACCILPASSEECADSIECEEPLFKAVFRTKLCSTGKIFEETPEFHPCSSCS